MNESEGLSLTEERQSPQLRVGPRVVDGIAAIGREVVEILDLILGLKDWLRAPQAVRGLLIDVVLPAAIGAKYDPASICRPDGIHIVGRVESKARTGSALQVVDPDVALAFVPQRDGKLGPVG